MPFRLFAYAPEPAAPSSLRSLKEPEGPSAALPDRARIRGQLAVGRAGHRSGVSLASEFLVYPDLGGVPLELELVMGWAR